MAILNYNQLSMMIIIKQKYKRAMSKTLYIYVACYQQHQTCAAQRALGSKGIPGVISIELSIPRICAYNCKCNICSNEFGYIV